MRDAEIARLHHQRLQNAHHVSVVIYEDSDQIVDDHTKEDKTNLDLFQVAMSSRHFEGQELILNAKIFGCPQNRRRPFAVYLATMPGAIVQSKGRTVLDQLTTLISLLGVCCRSALQRKMSCYQMRTKCCIGSCVCLRQNLLVAAKSRLGKLITARSIANTTSFGVRIRLARLLRIPIGFGLRAATSSRCLRTTSTVFLHGPGV